MISLLLSSNPIIKLFKVLAKIAIILLVILAIFVGIIRALFPYIDQYRTWFEQKLSSAIDQPVKIGEVQASWKGLHPIIRFDKVIILDNAQRKDVIHISTLQVGVNVLRSLFNRNVVPQSLRISGISLSIREEENRQLEINGIKTNITTNTSTISANEGIEQFFSWLLSRGEISLDHVDLDWHGKNGVVLPLTNVELTIRNGLFQQQIIGLATLVQKVPAKIRFVIMLEGDILKKEVLKASTYFYAKEVQIEPWMKQYVWQGITLTQARLNTLEVWANWENGQFQEIQSLFNFKGVSFYSTAAREALKLNNFAGNLAWKRNEDGWTVAADHLTLNINGHTWPLNQLALRIANAPSGRTEVLKLDAVDVIRLHQILFLLPPLESSFREIISDLQPRGMFKNVTLQHDVLLDSRPAHVISSEAEGTPDAGTFPRPAHVIPSEAEGSPYTGNFPSPCARHPERSRGISLCWRTFPSPCVRHPERSRGISLC